MALSLMALKAVTEGEALSCSGAVEAETPTSRPSPRHPPASTLPVSSVLQAKVEESLTSGMQSW